MNHHFLTFFKEECFLEDVAQASPFSEILDSLNIKNQEERNKLTKAQEKLKGMKKN